MSKRDVSDTLRREIEYRRKLIDDCNAGVLLHFNTLQQRDN